MPETGIDFGTTNSIMVSYDKKTNQFTYFAKEGENPTPISSTVWYHDGQIEVGDNARKNMFTYADVEGHHFERSIKMKLGTGCHIDIFSHRTEPYEVAGEILKELVHQAKNEYKAKVNKINMNKAVFTVPISFSGKARQELRQSANEAGMEITTFIHEPFAAIIGHLFSKHEMEPIEHCLNELSAYQNQKWLIFDWGGGTLDVTVVDISDGKMRELGTSNLHGIAGDKFDETIAKYAWADFISRYGNKYSSEYLETVRKRRWGKMMTIAEECKINLSQYNEDDFILEKVVGGTEHIDLTISRELFEKLIAKDLDAAYNCIDDALNQAGLHEIDISHVLLTGGTCYMPAVQKRMAEKFGHRVEEVKNPELLIAQGAAVVSEMGWLPFITKDIQIQMCDDSYWPIFRNGMPIAAMGSAKESEKFVCVDGTKGKAKVIVGEGIDQSNDKTLAVLKVPLAGNPRYGDELLVEAELDKDIILTVRSHSLMEGKRVSAEIYQMCFGLEFNGK